MFFLIEYDRPSGKLLRFQRFDDSERQAALDARLELELRLNREGVKEREVVILEGPNEEIVRHTHGRYFKTPAELVDEWASKQ